MDWLNCAYIGGTRDSTLVQFALSLMSLLARTGAHPSHLSMCSYAFSHTLCVSDALLHACWSMYTRAGTHVADDGSYDSKQSDAWSQVSVLSEFHTGYPPAVSACCAAHGQHTCLWEPCTLLYFDLSCCLVSQTQSQGHSIASTFIGTLFVNLSLFVSLALSRALLRRLTCTRARSISISRWLFVYTHV